MLLEAIIDENWKSVIIEKLKDILYKQTNIFLTAQLKTSDEYYSFVYVNDINVNVLLKNEISSKNKSLKSAGLVFVLKLRF